MSKRAGVFDPWRQEAPPPRDIAPPKPFDPDSKKEDLTCVVFDGLRTSINVWVPEQESAETENLMARRQLIEATYQLYKSEDAAKILVTWGVVCEAQPKPENIVLTDDDRRSVTIKGSHPEDRLVPRAIDVLASAFRETVRTRASHQATLGRLHVVPLVK